MYLQSPGGSLFCSVPAGRQGCKVLHPGRDSETQSQQEHKGSSIPQGLQLNQVSGSSPKRTNKPGWCYQELWVCWALYWCRTVQNVHHGEGALHPDGPSYPSLQELLLLLPSLIPFGGPMGWSHPLSPDCGPDGWPLHSRLTASLKPRKKWLPRTREGKARVNHFH